MPLNLFYTMVQKSQKWPKTQIKGDPALNVFVCLALDGKNIHLAILPSEVVELAKHPPPLAERRPE